MSATLPAASDADVMNGAEIVLRALKDQGVEVIFGYPGGAVLPIYDAIFQQNAIRHVLVRHEQAAVHAAEGYARSTGKVGCVLVTSGPGATTLPMRIYSQVRLGVTPEINAISTIMIGVVATGVVIASLVAKRQEVRRLRDERLAQEAERLAVSSAG